MKNAKAMAKGMAATPMVRAEGSENLSADITRFSFIVGLLLVFTTSVTAERSTISSAPGCVWRDIAHG